MQKAFSLAIDALSGGQFLSQDKNGWVKYLSLKDMVGIFSVSSITAQATTA